MSERKKRREFTDEFKQQMVKVQVADDNFEFATQLSDYLTKDKGMNIRTTFD